MNIRVHIINLAGIIAFLSFLAGLTATVLAFTGSLDHQNFKLVFNLTSLVWFLAAPFWFTPRLFGRAFQEAGGRAWLRPKDPDRPPEE